MRQLKWIIGLVIGLVVVVSAGTFVYINFVKEDSPERLTFAETTTTTSLVAGSSVTSTTTGTFEVNGTWKPTAGSQVGYRVKEVLFGQSTEGVGRTSKVTGSLVVSDSKLTTVDLTVDMASMVSDQTRRDQQFTGRIMDTATYPTSKFTLTEPIALANTPTTTPTDVKAKGNLTLRGTTKPITADLKVRRNGNAVEVNGAIPIGTSPTRLFPELPPKITER